MKIFDFSCYRPYLRAKLSQLPKKGRGELSRLAKHMGLHTTAVTHIFKGDKPMNPDQAMSFAKYWGMTEAEIEYLLCLVQAERAVNKDLKVLMTEKAKELKEKGLDFGQRVKDRKILSEVQKAKFYSNWYYSGVRVLSSMTGTQTVDAISDYLNLPKPVVSEIVDFLLQSGLCVEKKKGLIEPGAMHTHVEAKSPYARSHHLNWRLKTAESYQNLTANDFVFTSPISVSKKDLEKIQKRFRILLDEIVEIVSQSPPEILACIGIDSVEIKRAK
jgi:uncharacterized protein (TIGR02147 family)